jgi:hypothetical protein
MEQQKNVILVYCLVPLLLYFTWCGDWEIYDNIQLEHDPLCAVDEVERDKGLGLVVGELVRPRHPAGVARARPRALVLPVEHRPAAALVVPFV